MPNPSPLDAPTGETPPSEHSSASSLLKWGAAVFVLIGGGITVWILDKAIRFPDAQARQFDNAAPLWIPAAIFVVVATVAGVYIMLRASRRVEHGENLFEQRHRRQHGDYIRSERAADDEDAVDEDAPSKGS